MSEEHPSPLSLEAARAVLAMKLDDGVVSRMSELAEKAGTATLDDAEAHEIDMYRRLSRLVDILKLKAKVVLQSRP